jgi:hypothetical protein
VSAHQQLLAEARSQLQLLQQELLAAQEGWARDREELEGRERQVGRPAGQHDREVEGVPM